MLGIHFNEFTLSNDIETNRLVDETYTCKNATIRIQMFNDAHYNDLKILLLIKNNLKTICFQG